MGLLKSSHSSCERAAFRLERWEQWDTLYCIWSSSLFQRTEGDYVALVAKSYKYPESIISWFLILKYIFKLDCYILFNMLHLLHQKNHLKMHTAYTVHLAPLDKYPQKKKKKLYSRRNSLLRYWFLMQENHELHLPSENTDSPFMSSITSTFHTKIAWWEPRLKNKSKLFSPQISRKAWARKCLSSSLQALSFCYVLDMMEQKSDKTKADTKRCLSRCMCTLNLTTVLKSKKIKGNNLCKVQLTHNVSTDFFNHQILG